MKFQELCDIILEIRDKEKVENPIAIEHQFGKLGFHIYAVSPLQFNILYGNIHERHRTLKEPELQFWIYSGVTVSARKSGSKSVFKFDDNIEKLAEKFPNEPYIEEIVEGILMLQAK